MAPRRALKRAAVAVGAVDDPPRGKVRRAEGIHGEDQAAAEGAETVEEGCRRLSQELATCSAVPKPCFEVLDAAILGGLGVPREARNKFQVSAVELLAKALLGFEKSLAARRGAAEASVASAATECAQLEVAKDAADAELVAKRRVAEEWTVKVADADRVLRQARRRRAEEAARAEEIRLEMQAPQTEVDHWDGVVAEQFRPLLEGTASKEEIFKRVNALKLLLKRLKVDNGLLSVFPIAAGKTPMNRGSFDKLVMQQAAEKFKGLAGEAREKLGALQAKLDELEVARRSMDQAIEEAEHAHKQAIEALEGARNARLEAVQTAQDAKAAVKAFSNAPAQRAVEAKAARSAEATFVQGPLATFQRLGGELAEAATLVQRKPTVAAKIAKDLSFVVAAAPMGA